MSLIQFCGHCCHFLDKSANHGIITCESFQLPPKHQEKNNFTIPVFPFQPLKNMFRGIQLHEVLYFCIFNNNTWIIAFVLTVTLCFVNHSSFIIEFVCLNSLWLTFFAGFTFNAHGLDFNIFIILRLHVFLRYRTHA